MAPEVEIPESGVNELDSACSVWSNLASACLCNDTEISLFSLFNCCAAKTRRLQTKRSHQGLGRGKIYEASVCVVPLCSWRLWQDDTKLGNFQGEFEGPPESLAEMQLLSAPSQLQPVVMEVPLPPMRWVQATSLSLGKNRIAAELTSCSRFHYVLRPLVSQLSGTVKAVMFEVASAQYWLVTLPSFT